MVGMIAGASLGAGLSALQIKENNKALDRQAKELLRQNAAMQLIFSTQQEVANIDAMEAVMTTEAQGAEVQRDVQAAGRKAEGTTAAVRGSGITGGRSIERAMMDVAQKTTKAETKVLSQIDTAVAGVYDNLRTVQGNLQASKINSNNQTISAINNLNAQKVSGFDALLTMAQGAIGGASTGASLESSIKANIGAGASIVPIETPELNTTTPYKATSKDIYSF